MERWKSVFCISGHLIEAITAIGRQKQQQLMALLFSHGILGFWDLYSIHVSPLCRFRELGFLSLYLLLVLHLLGEFRNQVSQSLILSGVNAVDL